MPILRSFWLPPVEQGVLENAAAGTYAGATRFTAEVRDALKFLREHGMVEFTRAGGYEQINGVWITEKGREYLAGKERND